MMVRPHFKKNFEGLNKLVSKGFSNENSLRRPSILCEAWKTNQCQSMPINGKQWQSMANNDTVKSFAQNAMVKMILLFSGMC